MNEQDRYPLIDAYFDGIRVTYELSPSFSSSCFGGPLEGHLFGDNENASLLHQIAYIARNDRPDKSYGLGIPLLYGLLFDGCDVEYRVKPAGIEIVRLWPDAPSEAWPYVDFPPVLPYWHIRIGQKASCSWNEYSTGILRTFDEQPAPLVMIMRPPLGVGVSLWGRNADMDGVQIIWEMDPSENHIKAYNCCT